jgi:rhodanese-related sulfurtransferase
MKKIFLLSAVLFIALLVAGCQSRSVSGEEVSVRGGAYRNITPRELSTMLKSKDFVFINVHIPFAGNIADTDLSIPYDQIEQNLNLLPADKNAKTVLYCRSGHMSKIAAEKLVSLGYTNIWNLEGGMADWEKAGYQIEK